MAAKLSEKSLSTFKVQCSMLNVDETAFFFEL
jgi:hypothetical protein